jgi:hypothetical protein
MGRCPTPHAQNSHYISDPPSSCSHLYYTAAGNDFDGQLPTDLGRINGLRRLEVADNAIDGSIPTEFGMLVNLELLLLNDNLGITGPLPSELGVCAELEELNVKDTSISGPFPAEIGNLPNLEKVYIEGTSLTGNLDSLACSGQYDFFNANCGGPGIECTCCSICCDSNGRNCVNGS